MDKFVCHTDVPDDGIITYVILARKGSPIRRTEMVRQMIAHAGAYAKGGRGSWTYGDNLLECIKLTAQGMHIEVAVTQAFAGKRAIEAVFKRVRMVEIIGDPGNYEEIVVIFE